MHIVPFPLRTFSNSDKHIAIATVTAEMAVAVFWDHAGKTRELFSAPGTTGFQAEKGLLPKVQPHLG